MTTFRAIRTQWALNFASKLRGYMKPRFLSTQEIRDIGNDIKKELLKDKNASKVHNDWITELIKSLKESKNLIEIKRGFYANMAAIPRPTPAEMAHLIQNNAVVSLHSVLGENGVLNNPSEIIMAIVPTDSNKWDGHGVKNFKVTLKGIGDFKFHLMPEKFVNLKGRWLVDSDLIDETKSYPSATIEKSICDWLYLSNNKRSSLYGLELPENTDLSYVNMRKLSKIAAEMGIENELNQYLEKKKIYDSSNDVKYNSSSKLGF